MPRGGARPNSGPKPFPPERLRSHTVSFKINNDELYQLTEVMALMGFKTKGGALRAAIKMVYEKVNLNTNEKGK